jgi:hypothetical protein
MTALHIRASRREPFLTRWSGVHPLGGLQREKGQRTTVQVVLSGGVALENHRLRGKIDADSETRLKVRDCYLCVAQPRISGMTGLSELPIS